MVPSISRANLFFECNNCIFEGNHATGNGGGVFIEPFQAGRKSQDPDLDFYSTDVYITRIRHELMPMHDTSFVCRNCNFKNNYAMSIARGIGESGSPGYEMLSGGYGGALAISQGIRYHVEIMEALVGSDVGYKISRAFGSHGNVHVLLENAKFYHNFAWRDGGAVFASGGKTTSKQSKLRLEITKSHFDLNQAFQGSGGSVKVTKGDDNGDYLCNNGATCDMMQFGVEIMSTKFGTNLAGRMLVENDLVGDSILEDNSAAWRSYNNFDKACNKQCCNPEGGESTCSALSGTTSNFCQVHKPDAVTGESYACNDGVF